MCTATLTSWEGTVRNLRERVALAVTAGSPIERLLEFKKERGWQNLQIYSDTKSDYTRAYISADDGDDAGLNVFTRSDGTVRHFWSGEMSGEMADPGQDPRGAPDTDPLCRPHTRRPRRHLVPKARIQQPDNDQVRLKAITQAAYCGQVGTIAKENAVFRQRELLPDCL